MIRTYIAIGLVGALVATIPTVNAGENKPQTPEQKQNVEKLMELKKAMPPEALDVIKSHIAPTLHAVSQPKTFKCPTSKELKLGALKPDVKGLSFIVDMDGLHFKGSMTNKDIPANTTLAMVIVNREPNDKISFLSCEYNNGNRLILKFEESSALKGAQIKLNPDDVKLPYRTNNLIEGRETLMFLGNKEFIITDINSPQK